MKSIAFPKLFKSSSTNIVSDKKATQQNLKLLISSEKGEFAGDPGFGVSVRKYFFDQSGFILSDILVDEIYTQVKIFLPQVTVNRDDIRIVHKKDSIYAEISCINKIDFTTDTLNLAIFKEDER